jgi:hypothetical protein
MKLALIATIILAALVSVTPRSDARDQPFPRGQVHTEINSETPHWYQSPEWILIFVGSITAVFIGWQSWETRRAAKAAADSVAAINRQAGIMERQTAAIEKDLVLTQRPKIYVRNFYFSSPTGRLQNSVGVTAGSFLDGQFYIVNYGGTPAHLVESYCEVFLDISLPMERPYEGKDGGKELEIIQPGASTPRLFRRATPLTAPERMDIQQGQKHLYILGWVEYLDDVGTRRRMAFCRLYNFGTRRFTPVNNTDYEHQD